jgi:hypothetical protein
VAPALSLSRATIAAVVAGSLMLATTGCTPKDETTESGCASTVHDASVAIEVSDQVRLLDMPMVRCRSTVGSGAGTTAPLPATPR